ncbi:MAG: CCA tRNA nucleotidyltransferase, partial [Gemmatimonadetes bacterium]|nr:CCA tRNA nucleotidyltransferase [Gemmatimonadota bacterium]
DFTINAMAVSLNGRSFGELVDPFEGRSDLRKKRVRILHDRSFIDDPTRLFRAVRFEQRLRFRLEGGTERRFREAVAGGMIGNLSGPRLLEQLKLVCFEPDPWLVFNRLEGLEVLRAIHPALGSDEGLKTLVREISPSGVPASPARDGWWILYLVALFGPHRAETLRGVVDRLKPNRRLRKAIEDMSRWSAVERAVESGEIDTPADFFRAVRTLSEDTMLFVTLTHPDEGMRKRCETYYHQHRHMRLSIDGGTLKDLGIAEGPAYGRILDEVLSMKINGEIGTEEEERRAARDLRSRLHPPEP